ncbi:hypothetical protein SmJEL517_g01633 [Synchytrium microbalum]|uniref:Uncharacterized protein n=1 Tax=Synchytrium microbalum TaxID=1806994 RepID=A0A507CA13_9FUNG|nr:uncharacterized protein SmJEL517_g01633 [Synchytrium microbalum]TPX36321.1 hypothetical protein SmJEL517_g01633 [Synchytrium microbalum]
MPKQKSSSLQEHTFLPLSTRLNSNRHSSDSIDSQFASPDNDDSIPSASKRKGMPGFGMMNRIKGGVVVPLGLSGVAKQKKPHNWITIDISNIMQLFDTTDQTPFRKGQLDGTFLAFLETEAESIMLSKWRAHVPSSFALRITLQELPINNPAYLDRITGGASNQVEINTWTEGSNATELLRLASSDLRRQIKANFVISSKRSGNEVRRTRWSGIFALVTGLIILTACLFLSRLVVQSGSDGSSVFSSWSDVASQALVIVGWVAVWRPAELLLFAWLPSLERQRLLQRIADMHVEVAYGSSSFEDES